VELLGCGASARGLPLLEFGEILVLYGAMRNVLVIGGTTGIGRAISEAFIKSNCQVTVTGITAEEVQNLQREVKGIAANVLDVRDEAGITGLLSCFKRLDVLVNSAGITFRAGREFNPAEFSQVLDVNLTGTMRACVAARELLSQSTGCILNVASMLSYFGSGYIPAYSASKGGVAQLTKSLAIAWAEQGIRVNAVAPGWIETAFTAPLVQNKERSETIIGRTPMKRWGKPEDIAGAALFLCSKEAAFITGAVLPVDGGYSAA